MASERDRRHSIVVGLIALGVFIRLAIWYWMPETRFASDEALYYQNGVVLATTGVQKIFLPPVSSWLIATLKSFFPELTIGSLRLFWVLMDLAAVFVVARLAARMLLESDQRREWFAGIAAGFYILYVPAISYSEFMTSETPAVLLMLCVLLLLTGRRFTLPLRHAMAGLLTGILVLTRASLAGLLITIPVAIAVLSNDETLRRRVIEVVLFTATATLVVAGWAARNYYYEKEFTLSTNSYYNLYIGNSPVYQEDLNLFSPAATPEQIAFRKDRLSGVVSEAPLSLREMKRAAIENIFANKILFLRRALGRLARIFVPRTDHLELLGGESQVGVFSKWSLTLMMLANLQWAIALFCGVAGLLVMRGRARRFQVWFAACILGSIPLCLIAISKPRYSFVFDPLLIISACFFVLNRKENWHYLMRRHKYLYACLVLFFVWSWIAWSVFAISSRISLG